METKKVPVTRGDEKLVQATAFVPKNSFVVGVTVKMKDTGETVNCDAHVVNHVFAAPDFY